MLLLGLLDQPLLQGSASLGLLLKSISFFILPSELVFLNSMAF